MRMNFIDDMPEIKTINANAIAIQKTIYNELMPFVKFAEENNREEKLILKGKEEDIKATNLFGLKAKGYISLIIKKHPWTQKWEPLIEVGTHTYFLDDYYWLRLSSHKPELLSIILEQLEDIKNALSFLTKENLAL